MSGLPADFADLIAARDGASGVFTEPWQARAFALTLALGEAGLFSLRDFQAALTARIGAFETAACLTGGSDYYTRWVEALGDLLAARGLAGDARLAALEAAVVDDAASRKAHQQAQGRDAEGRRRIAPLVVDPAPARRAAP